jgi:predicted ATPase
VLGAALDSAGASAGRLVVVEGAAGVGKTRLLAQARAAAHERGHLVLPARAGEFERDFSFGVVRQLFEPVLHAAGDDERARMLAGAASLTASLFASRPGEPEPGGDRLFPVLHGLLWLTVNLSAEQPVTLLVDDLHWCDAPSLRFLVYLAHRLEDLPVAVVGTYRSSEPGADPALAGQLLTDARAVRVLPAELGADAAAAVLR